jgi:hypothetical protein
MAGTGCRDILHLCNILHILARDDLDYSGG